MFKGLGNLATLVKQAQQIGDRMQGVSDQLKGQKVQGTAGGGMVTIEVNGLQEILGCRIDPQLIQQGDRELLEDLVIAATNQALAKARQLHADAMRSMAGGIELPGLDEALAKFTGGGQTPTP
ncbi:MAG: YbaB/EbfC family nucleoid-associated protein [Planctomycetes bacterium]|nr:YbaB/EbfC family nucleoid-associated protein [Planctomycetota bacterium]